MDLNQNLSLEVVLRSVLSSYPFAQPSDQSSSSICSKSIPTRNIDRINGSLSYDEFFRKYMFANIPCIFSNWATKNWPSIELWTKNVNGKAVPSIKRLIQLGSAIVPVADCRKREYNSHPKKEMPFKDYLEYLSNYINDDHPSQESCLYLKDWHFKRDFPNYEAYFVPPYFTSDWLFELYSKKLPPFQDDFRFVYIGPKGSWTPFHVDVFRTYSWSANVCGRKQWLLYPPGYEEHIKQENGDLPYRITNLQDAEDMKKRPIEIIQETGEIVFIPSGWHHEVHNLEDTISINHNWLNGCNIEKVWKFLQSELNAVEREIMDCQSTMTASEWSQQCQFIMKLNSGINSEEFFSLLRNITDARVSYIREIFGINSDFEEMPYDLSSLLTISKFSMTNLLELLTNTKRTNNKVMNTSKDEKNILNILADLCLILPVFLDLFNSNVLNSLFSSSFEILKIVHEICLCLKSYSCYICEPTC